MMLVRFGKSGWNIFDGQKCWFENVLQRTVWVPLTLSALSNSSYTFRSTETPSCWSFSTWDVIHEKQFLLKNKTNIMSLATANAGLPVLVCLGNTLSHERLEGISSNLAQRHKDEFGGQGHCDLNNTCFFCHNSRVDAVMRWQHFYPRGQR